MEDKNIDIADQSASLTNRGPNNGDDARARYEAIKRLQDVREQVQFAWHLFDEGSINYDGLISQLKQAITRDQNGIWWTMDKDEQIWYRFENNAWNRAVLPFDLEELDLHGLQTKMERGTIDEGSHLRRRIPKGDVNQGVSERPLTIEELDHLVMQHVNATLRERRDVVRREFWTTQ